MATPRPRILLVDDQVLFVESLRCVLEERATDLEVVGVAHDGQEALEACIRLRPDVVLMDVRMPGMDGVMATRQIHEIYPKTRILMLTTFDDDQYVEVALRYGACGYLLKNIPPEELIRSIRAVKSSVAQISPEIVQRLTGRGSDAALYAESGPAMIETLTTREREILVLLLEARTNGEISNALSISEQTAKNHIHNVYEKLGVSGRLQLLKLFSQSRR